MPAVVSRVSPPPPTVPAPCPPPPTMVSGHLVLLMPGRQRRCCLSSPRPPSAACTLRPPGPGVAFWPLLFSWPRGAWARVGAHRDAQSSSAEAGDPPARPSEAQGPGRPPYQFEDSGKRALDILALEALVSRFVVGSSAAVAEAGLLALGALRGKGTARSGPRGPRRGAPRRDLHGGHSGAATARAPAVKTHPGGTQTPLPHADGPRCRLTAVLPPQVRGFRALDSGTGLRVNDALGRPFPASDDLDLVGEGTAGAEGSRAAELPGRGSEGSAGGGGGGLLRGKRSWTRGSRAGGGSGEGRTGVSG